MQFQKTILSAAVLMAVGVAQAADNVWVEKPNSVDFNVVSQGGQLGPQVYPILGESGIAKGQTGFIASVKGTSSGNTPSLILASGGKSIENAGDIWVYTGGEYGNYAEAMGIQYSHSGTVINSGRIFLKGTSLDGTKAMSVNTSGSGINKGLIVVDGGTAMAMNSGNQKTQRELRNERDIVVLKGYGFSSGKDDDGTNDTIVNATDAKLVVTGTSSKGVYFISGQSKKFSNEGDIVVSEGGTAIYSFTKNSTFDNEKSIIGVDDSAKGILLSLGNNQTINNSGLIDFKGTAISTGSIEATINLVGASQVNGTLDLNDKTDINIQNLTQSDDLTIKDDVRSIKIENSTVTLSNEGDQTLHVATLKSDNQSSTTFKLTRIGGQDDKVLVVDKVEGNGTVSVGYNGDAADQLYSQQKTFEDAFDGISVAGEQIDELKIDAEGSWGSDTTLRRDENGNITAETNHTNSLLRSATDLAKLNALTWRTQLTNLSDRMGTLRTLPNAAGAWARYNNGRLEGDDIQHDYNTIEVGVDARVSENFTVGMSFDYTRGDSDLEAGEADTNTYTVGLYGTYFNDNGCFLDMMAKIGRIDSSYDLNNGYAESGDYMMTGGILGVEAGHRWTINNYFVEPQLQLTYSYLRHEDYSTEIRSVDFETFKSMVGRIGVMTGLNFAENKGAAYLKASYNHDFLGDVDGRYSGKLFGQDVSYDVNDEMDSDWGEVSLGASYQVTDGLNAFMDVGTSFGGDIDQKWRVNLGARYVF